MKVKQLEDLFGYAIFLTVVFIITFKIRRFINELTWALATSFCITFTVFVLLNKFTHSVLLSGTVVVISAWYYFRQT